MERQKDAKQRRERERREKMDREREARATARQAREAARAEERRREREMQQQQQRERVLRERARREKCLNSRPIPKADLLSMLSYAFLPPGLDRGSVSTSLASSRPKRGPSISDITRQSGGDALAAGATASVSIRQHPSASVGKSEGDAFASGATAACCASLSPAEAASAEMPHTSRMLTYADVC